MGRRPRTGWRRSVRLLETNNRECGKRRERAHQSGVSRPLLDDELFAQDQAKGKIFRIAHLGYFDEFHICTAVIAIERGLADLGQKIDFGRGVGAAMRSFAASA